MWPLAKHFVLALLFDWWKNQPANVLAYVCLWCKSIHNFLKFLAHKRWRWQMTSRIVIWVVWERIFIKERYARLNISYGSNPNGCDTFSNKNSMPAPMPRNSSKKISSDYCTITVRRVIFCTPTADSLCIYRLSIGWLSAHTFHNGVDHCHSSVWSFVRPSPRSTRMWCQLCCTLLHNHSTVGSLSGLSK